MSHPLLCISNLNGTHSLASICTPLCCRFHHIFSLVLWPYSLHTSCAAFFVSWFLLSEITNIFLNMRTLLLKFQLGDTRLFVGASALFITSFFIVRIMPIPLMVAAWARADYAHTTVATFGVVLLSTPLPLLLNLYWFGLALKGAARMLRPKKQ